MSEDDSVVYIGDREDGLVRSVKRADVAKLTMGPPIEYAPIPSIMSRIVGGGRWSVTPVGLWCDGIRYGWLHLRDRCQGSPRPVLKPGQQAFFVTRVTGGEDPGVINIWVRCPEEAPHNCKGYARLSTVKEYGAPALGVLATNRRLPLPPLREDATPFSVEPGRTGAAVIPIRLNDWTTLATKAALGENAPAQLVRMQVTLSADPRGKSVFLRSEHSIRFTQPPAPTSGRGIARGPRRRRARPRATRSRSAGNSRSRRISRRMSRSGRAPRSGPAAPVPWSGWPPAASAGREPVEPRPGSGRAAARRRLGARRARPSRRAARAPRW